MSVNELCSGLGATPEQLKSKSRKSEIVNARKRVVFELYRNGIKQTEIAKQLTRTQSGISRLLQSYQPS